MWLSVCQARSMVRWRCLVVVLLVVSCSGATVTGQDPTANGVTSSSIRADVGQETSTTLMVLQKDRREVPAIARVIAAEPPVAWIADRDENGHVVVRGRFWSIDVGFDVTVEIADVGGEPGLVSALVEYSGMGFEDEPRAMVLDPSDVTWSVWESDEVAGWLRINRIWNPFVATTDGLGPRRAGDRRFSVEVGEVIETYGSGLGAVSWLLLDSIVVPCQGCEAEASLLWTAIRTNQVLQGVTELTNGRGRLPWDAFDGSEFCAALDWPLVTIEPCA